MVDAPLPGRLRDPTPNGAGSSRNSASIRISQKLGLRKRDQRSGVRFRGSLQTIEPQIEGEFLLSVA